MTKTVKTTKARQAKPAAKKETMTMTDNFKKAAAEAGEKANGMFKDAQARAKTSFEKAGSFAKDVAEFHKGNAEAMIESGKITAKGSQTAAQNAAEYGRKNWDATSTFVKSAAAVKAPTDFFKLQGDFARSQFDAMVGEFAKSGEFYAKLAGEVAQPLQARYATVRDQVKARYAA